MADPNKEKKKDRYPTEGESHDSIYEICMRLSNLSIAEYTLSVEMSFPFLSNLFGP